MQDLVKIILKSGKDQSAKRFHPWVFSGAVKKMHGQPAEGDLVAVYSNQDELLGIGHYQQSSIAVRIISFHEATIDRDFWYGKISNAIAYRRTTGLLSDESTNAYRLIHAEGDEMPGLIVDFYNGILVMQMHSIGMYQNRELFAGIFKELLGDAITTIYVKSSSTLPAAFRDTAEDTFLLGNQQSVEVQEYGHHFAIDVVEGQKTGFFIDQRDNRKLLAQYARDKKVLNMFGYTGAFSIYALHAGAREVYTVDSSQKAIELTDKNIALNFNSDVNHHGVVADAFKYLQELPDDFDLIILDPPAFAKHHNVLPNALQGYKRLNQRALEKIKSGGLLFTFSCSQVVSKENFRKSVFAAAANTGRSVKILHEMSQPVDHPVNIYHPESEYLKGLVVYVV
ncbi:MAG: methyltransferase [Bacteroidetes bacterium]|jgi:23S rRNA (cytosine1962-C5)-methyltransferase|nr:methyltransferase [Bacteroidota bacterium]